MCGRFTLYVSAGEIADHFDMAPSFNWEPRYNIAPSDKVPAVGLDEENSYGGSLFRWGLIPHWVDDPDEFKPNLINARSETVASKPAFRDSFKKRRCLIPTTGFYEWQNTSEGKQPYYIGLDNDELFAFAGIWDRWTSHDNGETILSCSILTTEASDQLQSIHERMPVVIDSNRYRSWLDPDDPSEMLETLLAGTQSGDFETYPVDDQVNSPTVDDATCVRSVE